ncbi:MAG: tRNA uridine(34) 5-carboxymethylaminomethyl modification radical SAM/GNAT enzyme Elp3 [Candidatus Falkowbacteria bacterium]|nr:tRNA uridine(34) 5-carboxymethylaminomethyl modification radical SAM/GNAT enzyme Elp3 [Candidatus Falkowbacteria bacterium]
MIASKTAKNKEKLKKQAIADLLKYKLKSRNDLMLAKRKVAKKYGIKILLNSEVLQYYQAEIKQGLRKYDGELVKILRKRSIRTLSGIAPVAVLTKSYPCPGQCTYCPTEKNVPQSYLSNEPAVMRAIRCKYHPYLQVRDRLHALVANGHEPTKIELIVIGGTWSVLPEKYKHWYIKECFRAANEFSEKISITKHQETNKFQYPMTKLKNELLVEQKKNERAKYRIIGITLETRPDYIDDKELLEMRELGCTRVEIGVQAIDDQILKLNKRGHNVAAIARATKMLKNYGFKVTYHLMPGLPGSTPAKDFKMYKQLFVDTRFQPDQIKFYPTVVTRGSLLYRWWKGGKYKPYSKKALENLIIKCKAVTPKYVRIIRLIRDIPAESIIAGNIVTNLRQVMQSRGVECKCIRCREARDKKFKIYDLRFRILKYKASEGEEYFISCESKDGKTLYGFCRLRLLDDKRNTASLLFAKEEDRRSSGVILKELTPALPLPKGGSRFVALIRELHVYGELVSVGNPSTLLRTSKKIQHSGLGKRLLTEAEKIAKNKGYQKIVIISGVGAREYYRKLGYKLENSYMVKKI